jgi:hypothetical protein
MFESISRGGRPVPRHVGLPIVLSIVVQGAVISALTVTSMMASEPLPEVHRISAFVAPLPPPPTLAPSPPKQRPVKHTPVATQPPPVIEPEKVTPSEDVEGRSDDSLDEGSTALNESRVAFREVAPPCTNGVTSRCS